MSRALRYLRRHHIGLAALFIALGGTSYAAVTLPKNSVGANQIRSNAVGSAEIKAGAVGTSEVKNGSLTANDFKAGTLLKGDTGPQGPKGDTGPAGPAGPAGPVETFSARVRLTGASIPVASTTDGAPNVPLVFTDAGVQHEVGGDFFNTANPTVEGSVPGAGYLRIPKTGTYIVSAGVRWEVNDQGSRSLFISGPNGAPPAPGILATSVTRPNTDTSASARTQQNVSTTVRLNEGDHVYAAVGQSSGSTLQVQGSLNQVFLAATYVGP